MQRSLAFIGEQLDALPEGRVLEPVGPLAADQAVVTLIEGWRGEICHVAITGRDGRFAAYKVVDPSFHNWFGLAMALRNQQISDFPLCNKSFNLSYCGHDLVERRRRCTMFDVLLARWKQGHRTMRYPAGPPPELPERFAGRPALDAAKCRGAVPAMRRGLPDRRHRLGAERPRRPARHGAMPVLPRVRDGLRGRGDHVLARLPDGRVAARGSDRCAMPRGEAAVALDETPRRLFGRSLKLRQVSAGGCNACEADTNVLGTVAWDLGRFGIQFVASPRHADGLLITGPVPENMRLALEKTYDAVPWPKLVIAVGACAISGGPYVDHPEVHNGVAGPAAGRSVRSRLPAAPADDSGRSAVALGLAPATDV